MKIRTCIFLPKTQKQGIWGRVREVAPNFLELPICSTRKCICSMKTKNNKDPIKEKDDALETEAERIKRKREEINKEIEELQKILKKRIIDNN